jgi:hypothetical protein
MGTQPALWSRSSWIALDGSRTARQEVSAPRIGGNAAAYSLSAMRRPTLPAGGATRPGVAHVGPLRLRVPRTGQGAGPRAAGAVSP